MKKFYSAKKNQVGSSGKKTFIFKESLYIVLPVLLTVVLFTASFYFLTIPLLEKSLMNERQNLSRDMVSVALDILEHHRIMTESGDLDPDEARLKAKEHLKQMRYGPENKDYFWIHNTGTKMIMHPFRADLEGQDISDFRDVKGKRLFSEMVTLVNKNDSGQIKYYWQKHGDSTQIVPKLSFVKLYEPWGWIVGTGIYLDDVGANIAAIRNRLIEVNAVLFLLILLLSAFVIYRSLKEKENTIKQRDYLQSIISGMPIIVCGLDSEYQVRFTNPAMESILKWQSDDLKGEHISELISDEEYKQEFKEKIGGEGLKNFDIPCRIKNGGEKIITWNTVEIFNKKGKIEEILCFGYDVTEKINTEKELISAKERAEESDRLKSAFLASMSHELRTPLNSIIGFSEIAGKDSKVGDLLDFLKTINLKGKELLYLIEDTFSIALLQTGRVKLRTEEFSLHDYFSQLAVYVNQISEAYSKNEIQVITPDTENLTLHLKTDKSKLNQVFINLLKNAFKFTEKGSIEYGYFLKGDTITFYVKDTGIGIPEDKQSIIFEKFRQADDYGEQFYGGTGLGLAICKDLMKLLNGRIDVESQPGKGSTFYFELYDALTEKKSINEGDRNNKEEKYNWKNKKILIVEDDESNYKYLYHLLKKYNAVLIHAWNGLQAYDIIKDEDGIAMILMDLRMPNMDGFTATKEIKQLKPDIPVIAQTAYAFQRDIDQALKSGCDDYVIKPINEKDLLTLIDRYIKADA